MMTDQSAGHRARMSKKNQRIIPGLPLIKVGHGGRTYGRDGIVYMLVLPFVLLLS